MNKDLINRQAVINAIANTCFWLSADNWDELMKAINSVPSGIKKGYWKDGMNETCSVCSAELHDIYCISDATDCTNVAFYCPHCGAYMEREPEVTLEFVKNKEDKSKECGDCKFFRTSGWEAPSGKCSKHPEFKDVCMAYNCFPEDATVCDDFVERYPEHKETNKIILEFKNGNYIKYGRNL